MKQESSLTGISTDFQQDHDDHHNAASEDTLCCSQRSSQESRYQSQNKQVSDTCNPLDHIAMNGAKPHENSTDGPGSEMTMCSNMDTNTNTNANPKTNINGNSLTDQNTPTLTPTPIPTNISHEEQGRSPQRQSTDNTRFLDDKSTLFKIVFVIVTCATQLITQGQLGMVMIPLVDIGHWLGTEDAGQMSWMAASYGLTVGIMVVVSGRVGDIFGPKLIWATGCTITIISNIGSGFCSSPIPFEICRAIAGIGAALSLPNALAILGRTYPPGKMRNIVFAILGALAPAGFSLGGTVAAIFAVLVGVEWIWWFTAIFTSVFLISGLLVLPSDHRGSSSSPSLKTSSKATVYDKIRSFDYVGTVLLILSMGLFNFIWNQSALVGWQTPYIYILLIVSILGFASFYFYERRLGSSALIPMEVLSKQNLLVYLSLWLGWMSFGIWLLYTILFIHNIRGHHNALIIAAQLSPALPGGIAAAMFVPYLINRFAGHYIFLTSMISFFIGNLFAALNIKDQTYWGLTFFSVILVISGPDLSFSTGQLIVSNSVEHDFQGIAAGIVSMITNYSLSIGLGMAGTVERYVKGPGETPDDLLKGYRAAFWFGTGLAGFATIVVGLFVRMPKQTHGHENSEKNGMEGQEGGERR